MFSFDKHFLFVLNCLDIISKVQRLLCTSLSVSWANQLPMLLTFRQHLAALCQWQAFLLINIMVITAVS